MIMTSTIPALFRRYEYGTLWWCEENTVRDRFAGWRVNDRACHPVISIHKTSPVLADDGDIPMLVGSSGHNGPVLVRGLSPDRGPDHPTVFGRIVAPGHFRHEDFYPEIGTLVAEGKRVFTVQPAAVWPNSHKPHVNATEQAYLDDFFERHVANTHQGRYKHDGQ